MASPIHPIELARLLRLEFGIAFTIGRRRTLIWLTARGHEALRRNREVLSVDMLASAMAQLPPGQADELMAGLRTLVDLAAPTANHRNDPI